MIVRSLGRWMRCGESGGPCLCFCLCLCLYRGGFSSGGRRGGGGGNGLLFRSLRSQMRKRTRRMKRRWMTIGGLGPIFCASDDYDNPNGGHAVLLYDVCCSLSVTRSLGAFLSVSLSRLRAERWSGRWVVTRWVWAQCQEQRQTVVVGSGLELVSTGSRNGYELPVDQKNIRSILQ